MVEAAIVMPVIILVAILMIRLFVFYIEILTVGISEHEAAVKACETYEGKSVEKYEGEQTIWFVRGGLLATNLSKSIKSEAYLINEDSLVRTGEYFEKIK